MRVECCKKWLKPYFLRELEPEPARKTPALVKNGLAPQHCRQYTVSVPFNMFFLGKMCPSLPGLLVLLQVEGVGESLVVGQPGVVT